MRLEGAIKSGRISASNFTERVGTTCAKTWEAGISIISVLLDRAQQQFARQRV
jgi:hypothetical protein